MDAVNHFLAVHMATVNMRDDDGWTPLHEAADWGHASVVSVLLAAGASVSAKRTSYSRGAVLLFDVGNTPLHNAARRGHGSVVSVLLVAGADVNAKSDNGNTPLHFAAWYGAVSVVSALIAAGAEVNTKSDNGNTPLHSAAGRGYASVVSVVSVLLVAGADVNAKDNSGRTPMHRAASRLNPASAASALLSVLLAAGADVNAKDNSGETPLRGTCYSSSNGNILCPYSFAAFRRVLIAAGGHWGKACTGLFSVSGSPSIPCICKSPNVSRTSEDCAAPSAGSCGGLTPPKFYDSAAGKCVAVAECATPSVLHAEANLCDCPAPNIGTDRADTPGDCAVPSAESCEGLTPVKFYDASTGKCVESCGGLIPAKFYDASAGGCVAVVECAAPSVLNAGTNRCDCPAPNVGVGRGGRAGGVRRRQRGKLWGIDSGKILRFFGGGMHPVCRLSDRGDIESRCESMRMRRGRRAQ